MGRLFEIVLTQPLFNLLVLLTVWIPDHSLGWGIVILTLLIRAALIPSVAQGLKQQQKLKKLQPELKEVQEKYKDNQEQLAKEMMLLYQKHDVHPLGSCLPLLIQLPILLALYHVFINGVDTSRFDLLYSFVPRPESINTVFFGIDLAKPDRLFILPILAGLLQFVQSKMMLRDTMPVADNTTQRLLNTQLQYLMPAITVGISVTLPAALPLYWVVTTLFGIIQQELLFRPYRKPDMLESTTDQIAPQKKEAIEQRGQVAVVVRKKGSK